MALVASTLLHLAEVAQWASLVGQHHGHKVADELIASVIEYHRVVGAVLVCSHMVVLVERHALVVHVYVVAQYAYAHHAQSIAQSPVAPVVSWTLSEVAVARVEPSVVATAQEIDGRIVPRAYHIPTERLEVFAAPALIVAHQFGGVGQFVAVNTGGERQVGVAAHILVALRPRHEYAHCGIGVGRRAADFPAQSVLVGHGCAASHIHVVLAAAASAHDSLHRPCLYVGAAVLVGAQYFPRLGYGRVAFGQQFLCPVDVLL